MQSYHRNKKIDLIEELLKDPSSFSFVQAIRILSKKAGKDFFRNIDIKPELTLKFPTSDIAKINKKGDRYEVVATFLGLYGTSSPLPTFYTEELIEERNNDKSVKRDFIDIFNKRAYELYFYIFLTSYPSIYLYEYGNEELKKIFLKEPFSLSVEKIKKLLNRFDTEVEEFVSDYTVVEDEQTTKLSFQNNKLGYDTHLGNKFLHKNKFIIKIKNLNKEEFFHFLKSRKKYSQIINKNLKQSLYWAWCVEFEKSCSFSLDESYLGINSVVGKCNKFIIKDTQ